MEEDWLTAGPLIENMETSNQTDSRGKAHDRSEATPTDMRWADSFHDPEGNGSGRGHATSDSPIRRSGISKHALEVPDNGVSSKVNMLESRVVHTGRYRSTVGCVSKRCPHICAFENCRDEAEDIIPGIQCWPA